MRRFLTIWMTTITAALLISCGADQAMKKGASDSEYDYIIDESKCVNCFSCIDHYPGGCYMRRVLLPRGKNYGK